MTGTYRTEGDIPNEECPVCRSNMIPLTRDIRPDQMVDPLLTVVGWTCPNGCEADVENYNRAIAEKMKGPD
jgi:hypothetical protein